MSDDLLRRIDQSIAEAEIADGASAPASDIPLADQIDEIEEARRREYVDALAFWITALLTAFFLLCVAGLVLWQGGRRYERLYGAGIHESRFYR